MKTARQHLTAIAIYALMCIPFLIGISFEYRTQMIAGFGEDPLQWMWFLAWWPHAILHGLNPLHPNCVFAPHGESIAWATSTPLQCLLVAPITLTLGLAPAYNTIATTAIILNGWAAYWLCRCANAKHTPAVIAGAIFTYSPYFIAEMLGRPNNYCFYPIPIYYALTALLIQQRISQTKYAIAAGTTLAALFYTSPELAAETAMMTSIAAIIWWMTSQTDRNKIQTALPAAITAGLLAITAASPFIYAMLTTPHPAQIFPPLLTAADAANFIIPTPITWLGGNRWEYIQMMWHSYIAEQDDYLGIPLILLLYSYWKSNRNNPRARTLTYCTAASAILAMGPVMQICGYCTNIPLPGLLIYVTPMLHEMFPTRLAAFTMLGATTTLAVWLTTSNTNTWKKAAATSIIAITLWPNFPNGWWNVTQQDPKFFKRQTYKQYIQPNSNVLILPAGAEAHDCYWQAQSHFYWNMPRGWLGAAVPGNHYSTHIASYQFPQWLRKHNVQTVLVQTRYADRYRALTKQLGLPLNYTGGITIYTTPKGKTHEQQTIH